MTSPVDTTEADFPGYGTPGEKENRRPLDFDVSDFISDEDLEEIFQVVREETDFLSPFSSVQMPQDLPVTEAARACLAVGVRNILQVGVEEEYATLARETGESPPISPEDLAYHSLPFSMFKTEKFMSGGPGYCGPIWHLQFDGGPEMMVNVTRGNDTELGLGYRIEWLR